MDLLKKAQRTTGVGLSQSAPGLLQQQLDEAREAKAKEIPISTVTLHEAADVLVPMADTDAQRPATLRGGEITGYAAEEMNELKDNNDFNFGRVTHVFTGLLRPGTHIRDGPGTFFYGNGAVFHGSYRNHHRAGCGCLLLPNGYFYEGYFRDDKSHGIGHEVFPNGEEYIGEYQQGKPHGKGILLSPRAGSRFEGSFENGEKHGAGAVYYDNGDIFVGSWELGKRQGYGVTTYAEQRRSYSSTWSDDQCDFKMRYVPPEGAIIPPRLNEHTFLSAVRSPLGTSLAELREFPDSIPELHPLHFRRIMTAFEELDTEFTGIVDLQNLREQFQERFAAPESPTASSSGGGGTLPQEAQEALAKYQRATKNGVSLELLEVMSALWTHLPSTELRRWITFDLPPEVILRLRGQLCGVTSKAADGFYTLSGGSNKINYSKMLIHRGTMGGMKVSLTTFKRIEGITGVDDSDEEEYEMRALAAQQSSGHHHRRSGTHAALQRQVYSEGRAVTVTFPQLLQQLFPNLWPDALLRVELETLPDVLLERYAQAFDILDDQRIQYLSLERMKHSQHNFQVARACRLQSYPQETAYDREIKKGPLKHLAAWHLLDIVLTVPLVKLIDRTKTGYVSLLEILRFCFPNIPCLSTRERLGVTVKSEEVCRCVLCKFCSVRYNRPKPPNPYMDSQATW